MTALDDDPHRRPRSTATCGVGRRLRRPSSRRAAVSGWRSRRCSRLCTRVLWRIGGARRMRAALGWAIPRRGGRALPLRAVAGGPACGVRPSRLNRSVALKGPSPGTLAGGSYGNRLLVRDGRASSDRALPSVALMDCLWRGKQAPHGRRGQHVRPRRLTGNRLVGGRRWLDRT